MLAYVAGISYLCIVQGKGRQRPAEREARDGTTRCGGLRNGLQSSVPHVAAPQATR